MERQASGPIWMDGCADVSADGYGDGCADVSTNSSANRKLNASAGINDTKQVLVYRRYYCKINRAASQLGYI